MRNTIFFVVAFMAASASQSVRAQVACAALDGGKSLASGCAQCHGTNGTSGAFDALAGDNQADNYKKLKEMQVKDPTSNIMYPHARGYTNEQLSCITLYFSKQKGL